MGTECLLFMKELSSTLDHLMTSSLLAVRQLVWALSFLATFGHDGDFKCAAYFRAGFRNSGCLYPTKCSQANCFVDELKQDQFRGSGTLLCALFANHSLEFEGTDKVHKIWFKNYKEGFRGLNYLCTGLAIKGPKWFFIGHITLWRTFNWLKTIGSFGSHICRPHLVKH